MISIVWVSLFIVVGALVGNYLGIMGYIGEGWFWFGNQGLSYIQLGRAWQIGFFAGLVIWSPLVFRALWPARRRRGDAGCRALGAGLHQQRQVHPGLQLRDQPAFHGQHGAHSGEGKARRCRSPASRPPILQ
jgi:hypothetical protein